MSRITLKQLEALVLRINKLAKTPDTYMTMNANGERTININHYHLNQAYGGIKLVQTCSEGGGIRDITWNGYTTKSKLYDQLYAFISGLETGLHHADN